LQEEALSVQSGDVLLEGLIARPENGEAEKLVLLIGGSGPLDRNQNSSSVQLNLFSELALHLAEQGFASFRYDKRGCGESTGDYDATGHSDLVADACACLEHLKNHDDFSSADIYVLGHSEGTLIAPQVVAKIPGIAGQILVMPYLEKFTSLIRRQAEQSLKEIKKVPGFRGMMIRFFLLISGDQIAKQKKLIQRIQKTSEATIKIKKQVINAKWIREMIALEPAEIHGSVNTPTLAIAGEKDLQCDPNDIEILKEHIVGPLETHVVPDLTHILRCDPEEASTQHYAALAMEAVDVNTMRLVSDWLKRQ